MPSTLVEGDCIEYLKNMKEPVKCIFADPPDNVGKKYNLHEDHMSVKRYFQWIESIIHLGIAKSEIFWLSYNSRYTYNMVRRLPNFLVDSKGYYLEDFLWIFDFGKYSTYMMSVCHRPIMCIRRRESKIYLDPIRVESERMRSGDARAKGPKIPGSVWNFPRVVNTSIEYRKWIPNQHPVAIYDRIMKYSCTSGDTFIDLFAGSGTCFRARRLSPEVNVVGIEIDPFYCEMMCKEQSEIKLVRSQSNLTGVAQISTSDLHEIPAHFASK